MKETLEEILDLQSSWSHKNTPMMQVRKDLIRTKGPSWLNAFADEIADAAGLDKDDLLIEGSDGIGVKAEIPWIRFSSESRSPSATIGWYCVFLFDTRGEFVSLSLGMGSTRWTGEDFKSRGADVLMAGASWGRETVSSVTNKRADLTADIDLRARRTHLGSDYELGTAIAKKYPRADLPIESVLKRDVLYFAGLLKSVYKEIDLGKDPGGMAPEIVEAIDAAESTAGNNRKTKKAPYSRMTAEQKKSIERRAMRVTKAYLEDHGWDPGDIKDTGATKPYDYHCQSEEKELFVEVKGTTSLGEQVVLTRREVEHHLKVYPKNALSIVSGIELTGVNKTRAVKGEIRFIAPWKVNKDSLTVISYTYGVDG
jgi:hypothetical protein